MAAQQPTIPATSRGYQAGRRSRLEFGGLLHHGAVSEIRGKAACIAIRYGGGNVDATAAEERLEPRFVG